MTSTSSSPTRSSILSMLHGRASMRPDDVAMTFTDYTADPDGVRESLTWSQLSQRTMSVARELGHHASVGDRAVILAPQGLDYVAAFLGSMQAGMISVPLPLPHRGSNHDRVSTVFEDTSPAVVLTTADVAGDVGDYVDQSRMDTAPKIIEIESVSSKIQDGPNSQPVELPEVAYLQYSSGSTRQPTGVMLSHRNLTANFEQLMRIFFADSKAPSDMTIVSWLPFYHDMGLVLGICAPILGGFRAELSSPIAFLEKPSRWVRSLAENSHAWSSAPNFAFDMAARKTTDADLAGLDLGGVRGIISGAERVEPATLRRFVDRFAHFNFRDDMMRPAYGLAEATVFVAGGTWSDSAPEAHFDVDELSAGRVKPCAAGKGTVLVRYQVPRSPVVRIVDGDTRRECPADVIGEIWVNGENVAEGYWKKSPDEQRCFGAELVDPSAGAPVTPWLRTGDLGFIHDGELFIVGRIKDMLIVRGRNHYPEDIEATVQEITGGRVAALAISVKSAEELVAVIEVKSRADANGDTTPWLGRVKSDVTSAISNAHGLTVADVVLVAPGSLPTTTSGKIRRAACAEQYRQDEFARLDA